MKNKSKKNPAKKPDVEGAVWYIYSRNSRTNGVIMSEIEYVEPQLGVKCKDGQYRNLLQMADYASVAEVRRSRIDLELEFDIYFKPRGSDIPEPANFLKYSARRAGRELNRTLKRRARSKAKSRESEFAPPH